MALQVWLPLIDDPLENKGLLNTTVSYSGQYEYINSGKIGKSCWHDKSNGTVSFNYDVDLSNNKMSICFWLYLDPGLNGNWFKIFSFGQYGNRLETNWRLGGSGYSPTNRLSWANSGDFSDNSTILAPDHYAGGIFGTTGVEDGTWTHIALTFDGSECKYYQDGMLLTTLTQKNTLATAFGNNKTVILSSSNNYYLRGCFNDFRMYDHVLSLKEVQEIAKGLVLHYPLDYMYNIFNDTSGYGNNGTELGTGIITCVLGGGVKPPKHKKYAAFYPPSQVLISNRVFCFDQLTVNFWVRVNDWVEASSTNIAFFSCTEGGGWNFYVTGNTISFVIQGDSKKGTSTYDKIESKTAVNSLNTTNNWHMLSGVFDGYSVKIYIDGVLDNSITCYTTKSSICYNYNTNLMIGAEISGTSTPAEPIATKEIDFADIRLYGTALSAEDIKKLYDTPISLDNEHNLYCYDMNEVSSGLKLNADGVIESVSFKETDNKQTKFEASQILSTNFYEF